MKGFLSLLCFMLVICGGLDCHAPGGRARTWYSFAPVIKQLLAYSGHNSLKKDLQMLTKVVNKGAMPPRLYRFMHRDSQLTPQDVETKKHGQQSAWRI